jgi:hypothetical protein
MRIYEYIIIPLFVVIVGGLFIKYHVALWTTLKHIVRNIVSFIKSIRESLRVWIKHKKKHPEITLKDHLKYEMKRKKRNNEMIKLSIYELEHGFPSFIKEVKRKHKIK